MPPEDNPADDVQDIDAMRAYYDSPVTVTAVAPCGHPIRDSTCIGGPNDQNLWRCKCGKEWLR